MGARIGITTFGAGFGAGMAYTQCKYKFDLKRGGIENLHEKIVAEVEVEKK